MTYPSEIQNDKFLFPKSDWVELQRARRGEDEEARNEKLEVPNSKSDDNGKWPKKSKLHTLPE